jgi:hypothetical protein
MGEPETSGRHPSEGSTAPERVTREDGSRFYPFPNVDTGEEEQFWSVTTALSVKNKDGLKWWAGKVSAARAMDSIPVMLASQRVEECGNTGSKTTTPCGRCPACVQAMIANVHIGESSRRAIEGSAVHNALEQYITTGRRLNAAEVANLDQRLLEQYPGRLIEALPPYLERLWEWIDDYAIVPEDFLASEMTVYSTRHRYAGTLDAILRLVVRNMKSARMVARLLGRPVYTGDSVAVVLDCKSREGEKKQIYDDHPLQLTAYRHADLCMPSKVDRLLRRMIPTEGAVVFQPRPDGYTFEPVLSGPEELATFLHLLAAYQWTVERGPASIAVKTFPVPGGTSGDFWMGERPPAATRCVNDTDGDGGCAACARDPEAPCRRPVATTVGATPDGVNGKAGSVGATCAGCGRVDPKRRSVNCKKATVCMLADGPALASGPQVRSTVVMPEALQAPPSRARATSATLESIARSRVPGATLTDDDIPF